MSPLVRKIIAVIGGIVVGAVVVFAAESVGHGLYPPPTDINLNNPEDMKRLVAAMPVEAKILVVIAWFLGALAGAWTAIKISAMPSLGWTIGLVFALLSLVTVFSIPHPVWMMACALIVPFVAAWIAVRYSGKVKEDSKW